MEQVNDLAFIVPFENLFSKPLDKERAF